ncbi:MAG: FG-GAP repeat protein, partial [Phycisphaerales bacterium]
QQAYLKASNTGGADNFGYSVAVSGDTVVVGANGEDSNATGVNGDQASNSAADSGAAYVFVRPSGGSTWTQQAYLKASNTGGADNFGYSVAVSGDTVVVGANGEDSNASGVNGDPVNNNAINSGAAYVFVRNAGAWTQEAYLKASNTGAGDQVGESLAVSGDTVVVGAIGESSNTAGVNGNQADNSAPGSGAAYVFVRSAGTWTQQAYLKASNPGAGEGGDWFGWSSAVSGDTVVVGAWREDSNATGVNGNQADNSALSSGAAYVFARPPGGTTWTQQAYLKASNTDADDRFGTSVAVSVDTIVIGADREDSNATGVNANEADNSASRSGAAYVFARPPGDTAWTQQAYLKASNTGAGDRFGWSVAASGDTIVVGAVLEASNATGVNGNQADNSASAGAAYVFVLPLTPPSCPLDYNLDTVVNPDDLGDFITDYYTPGHIPGPGGFAIPCPENDPPFDAGYKAAYTPDLSGQCTEPFPDNLGDFITDYYASPGC